MCFRPADTQAAKKTCSKCGTVNDFFADHCENCGELLASSGPNALRASGRPAAPAAPGRPGIPGAPSAPGRPNAPGKPGAPGEK